LIKFVDILYTYICAYVFTKVYCYGLVNVKEFTKIKRNMRG